MKATIACYKVTDEYPHGILAQLSAGDQREDEGRVILPSNSYMLYLEIDGQRVALVNTDELIRLARFWEYGRMSAEERAKRRL